MIIGYILCIPSDKAAFRIIQKGQDLFSYKAKAIILIIDYFVVALIYSWLEFSFQYLLAHVLTILGVRSNLNDWPVVQCNHHRLRITMSTDYLRTGILVREDRGLDLTFILPFIDIFLRTIKEPLLTWVVDNYWCDSFLLHYTIFGQFLFLLPYQQR